MICSGESGDQASGAGSPGGPGNFQTDKAVVVSAAGEMEWTVAGNCHLHFGQYILRIVTAVGRPAWERGNSGVARGEALSFGGKSVIGGTGANDDPMIDVAMFRRDGEWSRKRCAGLEFDGVATLGVIQSLLQIVSGVNGGDDAGSGRVGHCAGNRNSGEFGGAVVLALLLGRLRGDDC